MITQDTLASRLREYLQHRMTRAALVEWAERAMMNEEFDNPDLDTIRDMTCEQASVGEPPCTRRVANVDGMHRQVRRRMQTVMRLADLGAIR